MLLPTRGGCCCHLLAPGLHRDHGANPRNMGSTCHRRRRSDKGDDKFVGRLDSILGILWIPQFLTGLYRFGRVCLRAPRSPRRITEPVLRGEAWARSGTIFGLPLLGWLWGRLVGAGRRRECDGDRSGRTVDDTVDCPRSGGLPARAAPGYCADPCTSRTPHRLTTLKATPVNLVRARSPPCRPRQGWRTSSSSSPGAVLTGTLLRYKKRRR